MTATPAESLPATPEASRRPSPDDSGSEGSVPWYQPSGADVVFLLAAVLIFQAAQRTMLDDPGLGWHVRNIDAMQLRGSWLTSDPFSGPRGGATYFTNQWLGDLSLWLGWRWAGLEGIAAIATILIAFTLRCLYRMLRQDRIPWPVAALWTTLALMGTSCSWTARPNLFSLLFVLLTARICIQFHQGRISRRFTLWLVPLFLLWANTHGGFLAGFVILGTTLLIEAGLRVLGRDQETRWNAGSRAAQLVILLVLTFLATLINPYGVRLYSWVLQLLGDPYFMTLHQEWKSPDFRSPGAIRYELVILLFPLVLALTRQRPTLVELGLSIVWFHFALSGFRYVALWVLIVIPPLARCSLGIPWVQDLLAHLRESSKGALRSSPGPARWVWTLIGSLAILGVARGTMGQFAYHKPEIIPARALNELLRLHAERTEESGQAPVVFHAYDWGGYLTWHGWPRLHNWIDDRNEVQGKEHVEEYFAILRAEPIWKQRFRERDVSLVCVFPHAPLVRELEKDPHWQERYRDPHAVIFERTPPEPK
jgi:hypothetical protein